MAKKRLLRRKFRGNFGYLPGLGKAVVIFASLQHDSKCDSLHTCTKGLAERCLWSSFSLSKCLRFNKFHYVTRSDSFRWHVYSMGQGSAVHDLRYTGHVSV